MSDKHTAREYELKKHLRELETQRDELDTRMKTIWQQEDHRDTEIMTANRMLEQMGSACSARDKVIGQLIEEKQQMMSQMKNKRLEFATELEDEIRKKKQKIDWEMEDACMELASVQKKREEKQEQADNEDTDGVKANDRE